MSKVIICNHEQATCRYCTDELERLERLLRDAYKALLPDHRAGGWSELLKRIEQALPGIDRQ